MITRVTRGTVQPDAEGQVFAALRAAVDPMPDVPGLTSLAILRRIEGKHVVVMGIATWTDIASMATVLGPDWHEPTWLPGLEEVIIDASVEIFETVATSLEEVAELSLVS